MTKMLSAPNAAPYIIATTTVGKLARRMLSASHEVARAMPRGFYTPTALDILLAVYIAEEDAVYLAAAELRMPGAPSPGLVARWLAALMEEGLIDEKEGLLALSEAGYSLVTSIVEAVYAAQRALD